MSEENTDVQESENPEEKETLETDEPQTDEGADASINSEDESENIAKQEEDIYAEELKKLKDKESEQDDILKEKDRQLKIKDRAIQAEKKKRKELESRTDDESDPVVWKDELRAELDRRDQMREVKEQLKGLTASKSEFDLALHHYEKTIRQSGNSEEDAVLAVAIANAKRFPELLQRFREESELEDTSAASMLGGGSTPQSGGLRAKSAVRKEAEKILKAVRPEAIKKLDKYIPR